MKFQVETQVAVHLLQRIVDGRDDAAHHTVGIRFGIHLEHLAESRVGIGTGAMPELLG